MKFNYELPKDVKDIIKQQIEAYPMFPEDREAFSRVLKSFAEFGYSLAQEEVEKKIYQAQFELIHGYRNKIVLNSLSIEDVLGMLDSDAEYLQTEKGVIITNEILSMSNILSGQENMPQGVNDNQASPRVSIEDMEKEKINSELIHSLRSIDGLVDKMIMNVREPGYIGKDSLIDKQIMKLFEQGGLVDVLEHYLNPEHMNTAFTWSQIKKALTQDAIYDIRYKIDPK